MKVYRPLFFVIGLILIIGMACNFFSNNTPSSPTLPPVKQDTPAPDNTPSSNQSGGGVSTLGDAQNAVIQIESDGTFVDPQVGLVVNGAGRGSGFFIDSSGLAVTNNHVVTGAALLKVWVGGVQHSAQIMGVSECSDLAVIKVDGGPYPYLNWYTGPVKTGMEVYLAGFPLGEPQFSLTKGIISKEKADGQTSWASLDYVLGHDATSNPGNSGGPLITADGQVVGINFASIKSANQYFAIDSKTAQPVVDVLRTGKDEDSIGINGTAVRSNDGSFSGIWVSSVKSGSPADKAGVKPGDILYQMESLVLSTDGTMKDYCSILRTHKPEDTLSLTVIRYASGELLEGQLNGRVLAVTKKFNVSGGGGGDNGGNSGGGSSGGDYFTDSFDANSMSNYTVENRKKGSDEDKMKVNIKDGAMVFDLQANNLWVYVTYKPYKYTDVKISIKADNRGKNNNNVTLFCRQSSEGWYEFSIANNGLYWIYAYDATGAISKGWNVIFNGGSTAIKQGKDSNEYTASCVGDKLTLSINGTEVKSIRDAKYKFREGTVGFGVSSFSTIPILVNVDSFTVSQP
jgi:serine protease Do